MKKLLALSLILSLCLPFSGAFASKHGKWNYVGESKFKHESSRIKSGGGDFKACLVSGPAGYYSLYMDKSFMKDINTGAQKLSKGKCITYKNIDSGKYYLTKSKKTGIAHVKFYD